MNGNKFINIKTLGAGFLLATAGMVFDVEKTAAPTIPQCEANFNNAERKFRQENGYILTNAQRSDFLRIMGGRRACIEEAQNGQPSYALKLKVL